MSGVPPRIGLLTRLHIRGRRITCPFDRVAEAVPARGLVASVGCGFGLLETDLARGSSSRLVIGVDDDPRKIRVAQALAADVSNARYGTGRLFDVLDPADRPVAILAVDVFYLIPHDAQEEFMRRARERLAPGGRLIVKDMAETPRVKAAWNRVQETLAVRVLRITRGADFHFRTVASFVDLFRRHGFHVAVTPLHRGYVHPHCLFIGTAV